MTIEDEWLGLVGYTKEIKNWYLRILLTIFIIAFLYRGILILAMFLLNIKN